MPQGEKEKKKKKNAPQRGKFLLHNSLWLKCFVNIVLYINWIKHIYIIYLLLYQSFYLSTSIWRIWIICWYFLPSTWDVRLPEKDKMCVPLKSISPEQRMFYETEEKLFYLHFGFGSYRVEDHGRPVIDNLQAASRLAIA